MVTIGEVPTPGWILRRGMNGPTYLVTRVPAWQVAALLLVPGVVIAAVAATASLQALMLVLGFDLVVILCAMVAVSHYRFLAGDGWVASEYVARRRLVRLGSLVKVDTYTSKTTTYLRLHDREGGSIAFGTSTVLPRVRDQVLPAILRADHAGELNISERTARDIGLR